MREIKFRGQDIKTGKWLYGQLTQTGNDYFINYDNAKNKVNPETICQFVCQKDKDNKDIYEGDVVNYKLEARLWLDPTELDWYDEDYYVYQVYETRGYVFFNKERSAFYIRDILWGRCHPESIGFEKHWAWDMFNDDDEDLTAPYDIEVIGNIYDNPELLEGMYD